MIRCAQYRFSARRSRRSKMRPDEPSCRSWYPRGSFRLRRRIAPCLRKAFAAFIRVGPRTCFDYRLSLNLRAYQNSRTFSFTNQTRLPRPRACGDSARRLKRIATSATPPTGTFSARRIASVNWIRAHERSWRGALIPLQTAHSAGLADTVRSAGKQSSLSYKLATTARPSSCWTHRF